MNKEQLNELLQLADDYYTINEDVLTQEDVDRINNLKSAIKSELGEQEMTTGDFAFWLNQHEDIRRVWAISALDWEPATKSLEEWLIYLSKTLDEHIANLREEGNW